MDPLLLVRPATDGFSIRYDIFMRNSETKYDANIFAEIL